MYCISYKELSLSKVAYIVPHLSDFDWTRRALQDAIPGLKRFAENNPIYDGGRVLREVI